MNLGKEVILTLLWQSGASDSATVRFVINLSICYWLFKCRVFTHCVCVCSLVCVCERERERERVKVQSHVCMCSRVWERETRSHNQRVCKHIRTSSLCLSRDSSLLGLEQMVKLRTLLTVFTFILKAKARDYEKGGPFLTHACGVRPITMHCVSWPIRADCDC